MAGAIGTLVVSAVIAAHPINAENWIGPNDYPIDALRQGRGGRSGFQLTVSKDGSPLACDIFISSGSVDLDLQTCRLVMKRARFEPARDADGNTAIGVYHNVSRWWTDDVPRDKIRGEEADLELTVNRLPKAIEAPAMATVAFAVDPTGGMTNCTPMLLETGRIGSKQLRQNQLVMDKLGSIACTQILSRYKPGPALVEGAAVPSVQTAKVRFVLADAP